MNAVVSTLMKYDVIMGHDKSDTIINITYASSIIDEKNLPF